MSFAFQRYRVPRLDVVMLRPWFNVISSLKRHLYSQSCQIGRLLLYGLLQLV